MKTALVLVAIVVLSGCQRMKVKETDGIKPFVSAESNAMIMMRTVSDASPPNERELQSQFLQVCNEHNSLIDQLIFDLAAKNAFSFSAEDYERSPEAGLRKQYIAAATQAVTEARTVDALRNAQVALVEAASSVSALRTGSLANAMATNDGRLVAAVAAAAPSINPSTELALAAAVFANQVTNNILQQHDNRVEAARERIRNELKSVKWGSCQEG